MRALLHDPEEDVFSLEVISTAGTIRGPAGEGVLRRRPGQHTCGWDGESGNGPECGSLPGRS